MRKNKTHHIIFGFFRLCLWLLTVFAAVAVILFCRSYIRNVSLAEYYNSRHWNVTTVPVSFSESAAALSSNPDRGTYKIYGFIIKDEPVDYKTYVTDNLRYDRDTALSLLQINLCRYNTGDISASGLENISALFDAFRSTGKHLLVRFLYDWDGRATKTEPENIDVILGHMRQLEPILRGNSDVIFMVQGLFTGNWGEMNGSRFSSKSDLQALASTLASVTDESTFLSVRTPYQWRFITDIIDFTSDMLQAHPYAWRFSLYNDGIMGNLTDCGTYSELGRAENGDNYLWNRAEELAFQNKLCLFVPNGGETILENPMNDFENAVPTLRQMHVTFLNQDYDLKILQKWAESTIDDGSVYSGMDGYTYIARHLGYRLLIDSAKLDYRMADDSLSVLVNLRNVGFAPLYGNKEGRLILHGSDAQNDDGEPLSGEYGSYYLYRFAEDVAALSRTDGADEVFPLALEIPLSGLPAGSYDAYFQLWDNDTDTQLALAVENPHTLTGYKIGSLTIAETEPLPTLPKLPDLPFDLDSRIEEFFRPTFDAATDTK